ncbi:DUF4189 domain-containing protein [Xanthomonas dyei]|uniref:DUF4189 domain-containing protein n=1 Tax=Xanthomonas dyei TaxID=743699 RepID=A0A2S7BFM9_9XANT|nr:DUF4189 domain-containing protein [Xanthomonas dyei]PPU44050.1 hypothetical protein XdyCFBP7245_23095 [Xanthomonas dyei]
MLKNKFPHIFFLTLFFSTQTNAEGNCPQGQYPIGGQGVAACAPIPQSGSGVSQESRPLGRWKKTWGAIALDTVGETPYYGVPKGALSEAEAKQQSLERCMKLGANNCRVTLTYQNQCAAIAEPQINGKPSPDGLVQFIGRSKKEQAADDALAQCKTRNPGMQCKVIYEDCSEPIFEKF